MVLGVPGGCEVIAFHIWLLFVLPIRMAKKRVRNPIVLTLIFWIISPLWGTIILSIAGNSDKNSNYIL